ncbi:tRNA 2'-phosphotransferase 1 isoform X2 [Bombina bombina]|uniref:tRNA 2'-phosphotransferase 1 isoform X2 n=1 Tax=Bombina bombina TaxID=8345 RepID=UPI00235AEA4E|nr:tRNA 2'-phosphotransferase 1 isoform X2 [Bombina bombina]
MEGSQPGNRTRGGRGRKHDPDVRLSKLLSYALRHGANTLGLPIRSDGFVPVSSLLALPQFRSVSQGDVERVVSNNDKQRFTIQQSENGVLEIRANQGHSLQVEVDLTPLGEELPRQAIHGTYLHHWPSILQKGLSRMNRTHIHLSPELPGEDGGVISDGIPFFWSTNHVLLTPGDADGLLLPKYFLQVLQLQPQRQLLLAKQ